VTVPSALTPLALIGRNQEDGVVIICEQDVDQVTADEAGASEEPGEDLPAIVGYLASSERAGPVIEHRWAWI
jgi:hypothetical protein